MDIINLLRCGCYDPALFRIYIWGRLVHIPVRLLLISFLLYRKFICFLFFVFLGGVVSIAPIRRFTLTHLLLRSLMPCMENPRIDRLTADTTVQVRYEILGDGT